MRGNGTVFYPSAIEPWAEEFDHRDPGFDPLAIACAEGQKRAHGRHLLAFEAQQRLAHNVRSPPVSHQDLQERSSHLRLSDVVDLRLLEDQRG